MINDKQSKMARAATGMSVRELAKRAGVAVDTISRLEAGERLQQRTMDVIQSALEQAGVKFIDDGQTSAAGGPGVRLMTSPGEFDTDQSQTVQYPEHLAPDAPTGAGG